MAFYSPLNVSCYYSELVSTMNSINWISRFFSIFFSSPLFYNFTIVTQFQQKIEKTTAYVIYWVSSPQRPQLQSTSTSAFYKEIPSRQYWIDVGTVPARALTKECFLKFWKDNGAIRAKDAPSRLKLTFQTEKWITTSEWIQTSPLTTRWLYLFNQ